MIRWGLNQNFKKNRTYHEAVDAWVMFWSLLMCRHLSDNFLPELLTEIAQQVLKRARPIV
jgi:hypothetical protein